MFNIAILVIFGSLVSGWTLHFHHPNEKLSELNVFGEVLVESENKYTFVEKYPVKSSPTENTQWCVSLICGELDTYNSCLDFECFNYFESDFASLKNGVLNVQTSNDIISSVNYYKSKVKTGGNQLSTGIRLKMISGGETGGVEIMQNQKNHDKRKTITSEETAPDSRNTPLQQPEHEPKDEPTIKPPSADQEFIDVLKPAGFYSEGQTFIEKYWKYILPPLVVIFVIAQVSPQE